jgi:hypothetical protein
MKILTRRRQKEIYRRLAENDFIELNNDGSFKSAEIHFNNTSEIAYLIGGMKGISLVHHIMESYNKKEDDK